MDCSEYLEARLLACKIICINSYLHYFNYIYIIYYNLTCFIILLHYFITNIYMSVFFNCVCFKRCHVIVGPMGN